jgi:hypothetical protein
VNTHNAACSNSIFAIAPSSGSRCAAEALIGRATLTDGGFLYQRLPAATRTGRPALRGQARMLNRRLVEFRFNG